MFSVGQDKAASITFYVCVSVSWIGVEPEPFEMGGHLIEASGKLCLLDSMLTFLHKGFADVLFGSTWWFSAALL